MLAIYSPMIELEETERGVRAVDTAKNEVEIELEGWEPGGEGLEIERRVQATFSGVVERVRMPGRVAYIESAKRIRQRVIKYDEQRVVEADDHLIQTDDIVTVFLRTNQSFELRSEFETGAVYLTFPTKTPVTIGLRSHVDRPTEKIRIPPTPEGFAVALSALGSSHHTDTPDRSYPSMRGYPPIIELNDQSELLSGNLRNSESSVQLLLPPSYERLFCITPLAYYLGASVDIIETASPVIQFKDEEYEFSDTVEEFSHQVANLLSRSFYLDCLVRNVGPYGFDLFELDLLQQITLEPETVYNLPIDDRLEIYMGVDFESIADQFPQWPLSISIQPTVENITTLSHLSYCLSFIFPAESELLDEQTAVKRSLGDFYRSLTDKSSSSGIGNREIIDPKNRVGTLHGWIAEGIPLDAFKGLPCAFSNRIHSEMDFSSRSVAVVLNDSDMDAEFVDVANAYRDLESVRSIDVNQSSRLTTGELAELFRESYDIIHYIGHCDIEGLQCADGHFSLDSLSTIETRTAFLNACGSYNEGLNFIRRGGIACGVTIGDVLEDQARRVGETFARLLGRGFGFAFSLLLARRRAIMNRQYAVIGDGTNVLSQGETNDPTALHVSKTSSGKYRIRPNLSSPTIHGSIKFPFHDTTPVLLGNDTSQSIPKEAFGEMLRNTDQPIIYNEQFYWPDEFLKAHF